MKEVKLLGCGSPLVDILVDVDDAFLFKNVTGQKGGMVLVDVSVINEILSKVNSPIRTVSGGSASNTTVTLSKLGLKSGFLGKLAEDELGKLYLNYFHKLGSDTRQFKKSVKYNTGRCLSLVTPDSQRTMRTYLGAASDIVKEDVVESDFTEYSHLHIEGYMLDMQDVIFKVLELAKKNKLKISFDLASFEEVKTHRDKIEDILQRYIDVLFCNEDEAKAFCLSDNPEDIFLKVPDKVVALKVGKKGSIIKSGSEIVRTPAMIVEKPLDTTGAGDIWQAGFLYHYIYNREFKGEAIHKAANLGSLLGAEVVKVFGSEIPKIRWEYIRNYMKENKLK